MTEMRFAPGRHPEMSTEVGWVPGEFRPSRKADRARLAFVQLAGAQSLGRPEEHWFVQGYMSGAEND